MKAPTLPPNVAPNGAFVHKLKCWAESFDEILTGAKRAEVRTEDDRKFKAGDLLEMTRTNREGQTTIPTTSIRVEVTHVERFAGPLTLVGVTFDGVESGKLAPIAVLTLAPRFEKTTATE